MNSNVRSIDEVVNQQRIVLRLKQAVYKYAKQDVQILRRSLQGIDPLLRQELEARAFDGLLHEEHCDEESKELSTQACEPAESEILSQGDVGYLSKCSRP